MKQLILTPTEMATLLLLSVAVSEVLSEDITTDTPKNLRILQGDLERILYKEESPLNG